MGKMVLDKAAFTPGPWTMDNGPYRTTERIIRGPGNEYICRVNNLPNWEANANFIAAAPDMYAALEELITSFENGDRRMAHAYGRACEVYHKIRGIRP